MESIAPGRWPSCPRQVACHRQVAVLPQTGGRLIPRMGQDSFLLYSYYFSNATQLICLFAENRFPIDSTIYVYNMNT